MLCLVMCAQAYHLVHLPRHAAHTIVRLWHETHVARHVAHDFTAMVAPRAAHFFVAAVRHDEVRAVASCDRDPARRLRVQGIAHPPHEYEGAAAMLRLLSERENVADWGALAAQPRWYVEELYLLSEWNATSSDP